MPTLRQAAALLSAADTRDGRLAIATLLGFSEACIPLDASARRRLGLPEDTAQADLAEGRGSLRALLINAPTAPSVRAFLSSLAASLGGTSAHVLWIVIASVAGGAEVGVGTWQPGARGMRAVALAARREHVVASDAEALNALAASSDGEDLVVHTRWCELLGREALSRRFYRVLEHRVQSLADSVSGPSAEERAELALLHVSRLLFLSFLETKGWLDGDHAYLSRRYDECMATGGRFHHRVLLPLFFGTLNTRISQRAPAARQLGAVPFLNGGLFSRTALEKRHARLRFSDEAFGALFSDLLCAFRFTARERDEQWMDASIDPEMLGRAFESLMVQRERRSSGAFYTPHELVGHVTNRALAIALVGDGLPEARVEIALRGDLLTPAENAILARQLSALTVLDPACGSGAFLVHVLERVADLHQLTGDTRDLALIRREVLGRTIHGVDINPTAVWLCELRLWLSVIIESTETRMSAVPPLPNLDCNVRTGDTLAGNGFTELPSVVGAPRVLARLHRRYVRASGPGKLTLRKALAREERHRALAAIDRELTALSAVRRERVRARRAADLFGQRPPGDSGLQSAMRTDRQRAAALRRERRRIESGGALPFSFPSHFGAVHAQGGFRLIIGNPPWVRLHNIPVAARATLRQRFAVYREAAWEPGMRAGRASAGFASQVDLASMFVERSADLASPGGCVALLMPAKLWQSLAGGGMRRLVGSRLSLREIEDWTAAPAAFDAAVYPSVLVATRGAPADDTVLASVRVRGVTAQWTARATELRLCRNDLASPLLLLPPPARHAFDLLVTRGIALGRSALGPPMLGVKCGCNDAFLVDAISEQGNVVHVEQQGRRGVIERELLRPLLRGEAVTSWSIRRTRSAIVWTHSAPGAPLPALPTATAHWLSPWKRRLTARSDLRSPRMWWSLFRTEGADATQPRVVWSDFGRRPRAALLAAGDATVPLNTCYVVRCDDTEDALALCALINSPLAAAWLNAVAEPARGGWRRYLAWTVSLLPIPSDWPRARACLAPLAERALIGDAPDDEELLTEACAAYRLRRVDVEPLLAWCHPTTSS